MVFDMDNLALSHAPDGADPTRIAELESSLREVIDYLRTLPMHPATYRQANKAEDVLNRKHTFVLQGAKFYPYGALVVGAQLEGRILTIKTHQDANPSPQTEKRFAAALHRSLVHGVSFELKGHSVERGCQQ
jgi:hypothetical protein